MAKKKDETETVDLKHAQELLWDHWKSVERDASEKSDVNYISDPLLRQTLHNSVNHRQVTYRFCLLIQLLGKLTNPTIDCLRLQKKKGDPGDVTGWDARSLGRKVVAPFNRKQENVLGTSSDPYVGNPMRIPRMFRGDTSKKNVAGWNALIDVLERVEQKADPGFTEAVFRQVLIEMLRRQQALRFAYPVPPRISLETAIALATAFLGEKSGGDRGQALCAALFDAIGIHFGLYERVQRAAINASDRATGQAADLECIDPSGKVVLAVEVKERSLTLTDLEGTLHKCRQLDVKDIFFTTNGVKTEDRTSIDDRISSAFASGQNVYVFHFLDFARSILAIGGEPIRHTFLSRIGENLDNWNIQPRHRQAWKALLEGV
jgi:hypothetical protein